jgi:large subunit ribosomal protein L35
VPVAWHNQRLVPKMKTHSGAKKRFKVTGGGKVRARHAFRTHILQKKSPKRKRRLGEPAILSRDDVPRVKRLLGVASRSGGAGQGPRSSGGGS